MKWLTLSLALISAAFWVWYWAEDRFGGPDAHADLDALPIGVIAIVFTILTVIMLALWWFLVTLWRMS